MDYYFHYCAYSYAQFHRLDVQNVVPWKLSIPRTCSSLTNIV